MRMNANKKVHKRSRDPYQTLLRLMVGLLITALIGVGAFYLCSKLVENDFIQRRNALDAANAEAEVAFQARINAMESGRTSAALDTGASEDSDAELAHWEKTIENTLWRLTDESNKGLENTGTITLDRASLINGGLMLLNQWHALPGDFSDAELVSVGVSSGYTIQVQNAEVRLFPNAFSALSEAVAAAKEAGLEYYIVREAYRSNDTQTSLFEAQMTKLSDKYSGDILIEKTKASVNYPGTSDYQAGMSFRMDVYNRNDAALNKLKFQSESQQGKWLTENCWKYGIIFRFPVKDFPNSSWEDKSYKTNVSIELNLYRYVGKAHAAAMRVMGFCLEEYIEFLISHPHICLYQDGALKYEIVRLNVNENDPNYALPVPNPARDYQASLDNMGGIVMAYVY